MFDKGAAGAGASHAAAGMLAACAEAEPGEQRTMSGDARPSAYCRQPMKLFRTVTRDGRRKRLFVTPITSFV